MEVTISHFRRELFTLVEAALRGESVSFTHKGVRFDVVANQQAKVRSKLDNLTPLPIINPTFEGQPDGLQEEMARAWEEDWKSL